MKKTFAILTVGLILGTTGCATLGKPLTVPDDSAFDKPEPKPQRLPPAKTNIDPEEINDANYNDQAAELENEMRKERRFVSPAK